MPAFHLPATAVLTTQFAGAQEQMIATGLAVALEYPDQNRPLNARIAASCIDSG